MDLDKERYRERDYHVEREWERDKERSRERVEEYRDKDKTRERGEDRRGTDEHEHDDRKRPFRKGRGGMELKFGNQQPGGTATSYKKNRVLGHVSGLFGLGDFNIIRLTDLEDLYSQNYEDFSLATHRMGYHSPKDFLGDHNDFVVESNGDGVYWVRLSRLRGTQDREPHFAHIDRPNSRPLSSDERFDPDEIAELREKRKKRARVLALRIGRLFPRTKPRVRFTNLIDLYLTYFRNHGLQGDEVDFPELDSTDLLQTLKNIGYLKLRRYLCWFPEIFSVEENKSGVLYVNFLHSSHDADPENEKEIIRTTSSSITYSSSSSYSASEPEQAIADNIIAILEDKTGKELRMASLIGAYRQYYRLELMRDLKRLGFTKLKLFLGNFPNTFGIRGEMGSEHVYIVPTSKPVVPITRPGVSLTLPTSSVAPVLRSIVTTPAPVTNNSENTEKEKVTLTISHDQQTIVYRSDHVKKEELVFPERLPRKKAADYFDSYSGAEDEENGSQKPSGDRFEDENEQRTKRARYT